MKLLFRLLSRLPLRVNHAIGALLGRLALALSPAFRRRTLEHLCASGVAANRAQARLLARENAAELGRTVTELAWALFRRPEEVAATIVELSGWDIVERLRAERRPILFATPHLGGYDIGGRYLLGVLPVLGMYRPHKIVWVDAMLREGRNRGAASGEENVAPATVGGVRRLLRHLKGGGCTVVLPDQVPGEGEGVWAEFFGRPAYTMTLLGRLQESTGAALVFFRTERLPRGAGFRLKFDPPEATLPADRIAAARALNAAIERTVLACPSQYLWGYNRYKRPAGAPQPPGGLAEPAA